MNEKEQNFKNFLSFLMDVKCLNQLDKYTGKFNIFDVLRSTKTEIRHSNVLAWFLDPEKEHGFNYNVLEYFIKFARKTNSNEELDLSNAVVDVRREEQNIDILVVVENPKIVLVIENKTKTGEHDDQLRRYREDVETNYSDYDERLYLFLTPKEDEPSDREWKKMTYDDVKEILENEYNDHTFNDDGVKVLIDHYINVLAIHLTENADLTNICKKIYRKHFKALDLIHEHCNNIRLEWVEQKQKENKLVLGKSSDSIVRFTTPQLSVILPKDTKNKSDWGNNDFYYYELTQNDTHYYIKLAINYTAIRNKNLKTKADKILTFKGTKPGQYPKAFTVKIKKVNIDEDDFNVLDKLFEKVLEEEREIINHLNRNNKKK